MKYSKEILRRVRNWPDDYLKDLKCNWLNMGIDIDTVEAMSKQLHDRFSSLMDDVGVNMLNGILQYVQDKIDESKR